MGFAIAVRLRCLELRFAAVQLNELFNDLNLAVEQINAGASEAGELSNRSAEKAARMTRARY